MSTFALGKAGHSSTRTITMGQMTLIKLVDHEFSRAEGDSRRNSMCFIKRLREDVSHGVTYVVSLNSAPSICGYCGALGFVTGIRRQRHVGRSL